jgi:BolA protein
MARARQIDALLREAFPQARWTLHDESAAHAGHSGFDSRGSHFRLVMHSPRFAGLSILARHRLVYDALAPLLARDVHALALELHASDDAARTDPAHAA